MRAASVPQTVKTEMLRLLDGERQTVVYPNITRFSEKGVIRDVSADGKTCDIVYSSCAESEVDEIIARQIQAAQAAHYELEWKVYGHDRPRCLSERLVAAGFVADAPEAFMVFAASEDSAAQFGISAAAVRQVRDRTGLSDYQIIREEVLGRSCAQEVERYRLILENHPDSMSIYVAYVNDMPAACGRVYFHEASKFAGLYGGTTRQQFRKRGLFTHLVGVRIREAVRRGVFNVCVDALPTSEPILRRHGFEEVTYTQPFTLRARG